jgi:hypothetical protein
MPSSNDCPTGVGAAADAATTELEVSGAELTLLEVGLTATTTPTAVELTMATKPTLVFFDRIFVSSHLSDAFNLNYLRKGLRQSDLS